jgi:hypothetical protein
MIPADKADFAKIVLGFAELRGKTLSLAAVELYWNAMQHWTLENFKAAANHLVGVSQFMPTPYDFEQLRKAGRPTAGEAFAKAVKASGSAIECGYVTQNGTCGDDLIDRAVRALGGYGQIAMCDEDKLHFLERRFTEHYESLQDSEDVRSAVPEIAGPPQLGQLTGPLPLKNLIEQFQGRS